MSRDGLAKKGCPVDYKLSPSDLTYLYDDCKFCFTMKVKHGITRPSISLPQVFSVIANLQKDYYSGRHTREFCRQLPDGVVRYGEKWVRSAPISLASGSTCFINGRFDIVVEFDDGGYGVIDFKTRQEAEEPTAMYARQLASYAYALENPAAGSLGLSPVRRLGLLYFAPVACVLRGSRQSVEGPVSWAEVRKDDKAFVDFIAEVGCLLDRGVAEPQTCTRCPHCRTGQRCKATAWSPSAAACWCCQWCTFRELRQVPLSPVLGQNAVRRRFGSLSR
jgi:hypothetical protein